MREDWRHWIDRKSAVMSSAWFCGAYNRRLNFSTTLDVHTHLMSRGLATGTVVRKDEGEVDGMVVGIRCKVPLPLWLIMNLVGASTAASEL